MRFGHVCESATRAENCETKRHRHLSRLKSPLGPLQLNTYLFGFKLAGSLETSDPELLAEAKIDLTGSHAVVITDRHIEASSVRIARPANAGNSINSSSPNPVAMVTTPSATVQAIGAVAAAQGGTQNDGSGRAISRTTRRWQNTRPRWRSPSNSVKMSRRFHGEPARTSCS